MKLVKKILRLLPLLFIIGGLLSAINFSSVLTPGDIGPIFNFEWEMGAWDGINDSLTSLINNTSFESLYYWFTDNISSNYMVSWSFCIIVYELYLSLIFLMFDFINMVFDLANKFIRKGRNLDD